MEPPTTTIPGGDPGPNPTSAAGARPGPDPRPCANPPGGGPARLPWGLLAAGLALMGLGIWLGETARILNKATQVCLQCIGIG